MKISHIFFLCSAAISGLALVPRMRESEPGGLGTGSKSASILRDPEFLNGTIKEWSGIQYDNYLPELPPGWPNITAMGTGSSRDTKGRELAIEPRADVALRDNSNYFGRYAFMGVKIVLLSSGPVTWYGLVDSCKQLTQETGDGVQCVFGALCQVISIVTLVYQGSIWRGQLATKLTNNGWHVPGVTKRDEWVRTMARDLSNGLKTEVRHLGMWDGIESNRKRDSGPAVMREVFGIKSSGYDFHFTYMGRNVDGKDSFKLGLGDGSFNPSNKERRQNQLTDDNFYFSSGGIDFAAQSVEPSSSAAWSWGSTSDSVELSDIYNSVQCYLKGTDFESQNAINFQVYDSYADATLSAGIMSPFSSSQESAIRSMSISGGIGNNSCGAF